MPLTTASKTSRRLQWPARSLCAILLTGMLALLLAGCGGGDGDPDPNPTPPAGVTPAPPDLRVVSDITTAVAGNNITVSWTNPDQENITGFNIAWVNTGNATDKGAVELNSNQGNTSPGERVTYKITGLIYNTAYKITITVLYAPGDPATSSPVQSTTGMNPNGVAPTLAKPLPVSDIEFAAGDTNTSLIVSWTNPNQPNITGFIAGFNVTWQNTEDPSDNDTKELTVTNVNVSAAARVFVTLEDLLPNATYNLTIVVIYADGSSASAMPADPARTGSAGMTPSGDLDRDGFPNADDNCRTIANNRQLNHDKDLLGDACDDDDDNDGLGDLADACPRGDIGWISNASTDHDGDGCRDDSPEDLDDDNDAVPDLADACARNATGWTSDTDTDNDNDGCRDGDEDLDDDNDGVQDVGPDGQPLDNCQLVHNPSQTNTDGASDGGDACDLDDDDDGFPDEANATTAADVDDNNNGLIEIHTLDDLARLRDDLDGNGTDDGRFDEIAAVGSVGCPDGGCNGYELTRALNFSDADSYVTGSGNRAIWTDRTDGADGGWTPIGSCVGTDDCTAYMAIFDGRNHTLADLFVSANDEAAGVGLFGAFSGRLQNLHLLNVNISGIFRYGGGMVGYGKNARYENLSVTAVSLRLLPPDDRFTLSFLGGLIGNGGNADIRYVSVFDINGFVPSGSVPYFFGGLVGSGLQSNISDAVVSGGSIVGGAGLGGLVGGGLQSNIRNAYVSDVDIVGTESLGGLIGSGEDAIIRNAYVVGGSIGKAIAFGGSRVGGLVGDGEGSQIRYSYAAGGKISDTDDLFGGLLGLASSTTAVNASYWDNETTEQSASAGGHGRGLTTAELQNPTTFTGIYADWDNFWCDPNTGAETENSSQPTGFVRRWDLGNSTQYPALNCVPGGLSAQGR